MGYELLLGWSLAPTIFLFLLCLACTALTTHYWILGDWMITRSIQVPNFDVTKLEVDWKVTIVEYLTASTDAAIVSACLGMMAAIVCLLAWYKLRRSNIDEERNRARRRFWVAFACLALLTSFTSALATLILHYTQKGSDGFGCSYTTDAGGDRLVYCTREMASCRFIPDLARIVTEEWQQTWDNPWAISLSCNEGTAVKWLQLVIMATCVSICGMLGAQAWLRKTTRDERVLMPEFNGKVAVDRSEVSFAQWVVPDRI